MIVPYRELPDDAAGYSRPVVDVLVEEVDDVAIPCLVDSGSVNTLMPRWVARACGVALDDAPHRRLAVAASSTTVSFATVTLTAAAFAWSAEVGFCDPWPYGWGLLGHLSFFRFFTVTFRAADEELELTPISR